MQTIKVRSKAAPKRKVASRLTHRQAQAKQLILKMLLSVNPRVAA